MGQGCCNIVLTKWWGRTGDSTQVILSSFRRSMLYTVTKRESSMDTMRRTLNHITLYVIWRMRCSIVYSGKEATPPFITANAVKNERYMFVVSGHLYRPLPLSQPCGLRVKIKDGFGTRPPTFFGAGLSILVFL